MLRPPSALRSVLLGLAGIAALLVGLEALTRTFLVSPSAPHRYTDYGWIEAPGSRVIHSEEGYSRTRLNSYGLDDDEPDPHAAVRALLLGDSYGQSRQVPREEGFSRVAERALPGLDVINASRSGFSPLDYAAYLDPLLERFSPEVVVLTLNDGDVDNLRNSGLAGLDPETAIRRHREADAHRSAEAPGLLGAVSGVLRRSALATFMARRAIMLAHRERTRLGGKLGPAPASAADAKVREGEGVDAPVPEGVTALLDGIEAHVAARAPRVVYLYIPNLIYGSDGCRNKWPRRRDFFHAFADRTGARLVDTTEPLCAEYARTGQPMHGFENSRVGSGHLNARGHAVVGRAMASAIAEALDGTPR